MIFSSLELLHQTVTFCEIDTIFIQDLLKSTFYRESENAKGQERLLTYVANTLDESCDIQMASEFSSVQVCF
jgi:lipopolysaccharide biosynthesis protein